MLLQQCKSFEMVKFNENRSCIEIFFFLHVGFAYLRLMKTEVVLK